MPIISATPESNQTLPSTVKSRSAEDSDFTGISVRGTPERIVGRSNMPYHLLIVSYRDI